MPQWCERNPKNISLTQFTLAICEMGHCYEKLGQYLDAESKFDTVLEVHPSHVEATMTKNWILEKIKCEK